MFKWRGVQLTELIGVFTKAIFQYAHDWDVIMTTLAQYNTNVVLTSASLAWYGIAGDSLELSQSIQAARDAGISEYHELIAFFAGYGSHPEWRPLDHTLTPVDWVCPTKQAVRDRIDYVITDLVTNYDIDGICFDYVRYNGQDMCYCDECKAKFEEWLGEGVISPWPGDFAPGGSRQAEFLEWRIIPVTEVVADVRTLALSIDPNLIFNAAVYAVPWWGDAEEMQYWQRTNLGQDSADWVAKGYVDYVQPMIYRDDITKFTTTIERTYQYMVGGKSEKLVPFITTASPETGWNPVPLNVSTIEVELCRKYGRGCFIWKYYGPGFEETGTTPPDTRPYLQMIERTRLHRMRKFLPSTVLWRSD